MPFQGFVGHLLDFNSFLRPLNSTGLSHRSLLLACQTPLVFRSQRSVRSLLAAESQVAMLVLASSSSSRPCATASRCGAQPGRRSASACLLYIYSIYSTEFPAGPWSVLRRASSGQPSEPLRCSQGAHAVALRSFLNLRPGASCRRQLSEWPWQMSEHSWYSIFWPLLVQRRILVVLCLSVK
jgi:hypothetical protein